MEEEAKRSNAKSTNLKGRQPKKIDSDNSEPSDHKKRKIKANIKLQEEKEEVKEIPIKEEKLNEDFMKDEFGLKSQQNITVGNISSGKGSSSGENQTIKFAPKAFRPPSYKNTGGDDRMGCMPINSIEAQKSLNVLPNMSYSKYLIYLIA